MRAFSCSACGQLVFFENSACLRCGAPLGFLADDRELHTLIAGDDATFTLMGDDTATRVVRCANAMVASCNWLVPFVGDAVDVTNDTNDDDRRAAMDPPPTSTDPTVTGLCRCCELTRTRPSDDDTDALAAFAETEAAKRRLVFQVLELGLPLVPESDDHDGGLTFDLLSSRVHAVTIGHADGVITLDVAESDDAHREQVRQDLGEPYRTMLGHLRHEIGHYYWQRLIEPDPERLDAFRILFGDERQDYSAALESHYGTGEIAPGASDGWQDAHVSSYATMHPWEDWAETFAHELHILDTLQTAAAYGMTVSGPDVAGPPPADDLSAAPSADVDAVPFDAVLSDWLPLTYALNGLNRSMGKGDLYPFVLAPAVIEKLGFVHDVIRAVGSNDHDASAAAVDEAAGSASTSRAAVGARSGGGGV